MTDFNEIDLKRVKVPSFQERINKLNNMIAGARRIVFMTGAGISTGSGIPDFRSSDGLYATNPEYLLSATCLANEPHKFFDFIKNKMDFREAAPNIAHLKIAELQLARDVSVITQNIDGLHERAGSKVIATIHGTMSRCYCQDCLGEHNVEALYDHTIAYPICEDCGGIIRPDIVLYEEGLHSTEWDAALNWTRNADLFIVVGTSLMVTPASLLPHFFGREDRLVIISRDFAPIAAELVFREDIGTVFENIKIPKEVRK